MSKPKVIFLSHIIDEDTPLYAGRKSIKLRRVKSIDKGDTCNLMKWAFLNHTGTHVDAPLHFLNNSLSVTDFKPQSWIFKNVLLVNIPNITSGYMVTAQDIKSIANCELLLLRTGFQKYRGRSLYWSDSPALHPELCDWLIKKSPSLRAVGIDFISISNLKKRDIGRAAHKRFLGKGIILIEDMDLSRARRSPDRAIVAPLLVAKADASPCTVLGIYN